VPAQLKAATDHGRKVFNDAELRAAGITRFAAEAIPQLDDDEDEDDDEEAFPLPEYDLEPTQAAATSTEDVVAPTTVIKILDDDAPDEPTAAAVEKRWALEGADGSGLEALKAAVLHLTEVCCAAFLSHVSDRLKGHACRHVLQNDLPIFERSQKAIRKQGPGQGSIRGGGQPSVGHGRAQAGPARSDRAQHLSEYLDRRRVRGRERHDPRVRWRRRAQCAPTKGRRQAANALTTAVTPLHGRLDWLLFVESGLQRCVKFDPVPHQSYSPNKPCAF
jgi:hypothetical protein